MFRVHGYLFWIFHVFRTNLFYNLRVSSIREFLITYVGNTLELREFLLHGFQYEIINFGCAVCTCNKPALVNITGLPHY